MRMTGEEKRYYLLLMIATILNGLMMSLGMLQDIIAKKALAADNWQISLLTMVWPASAFFSIWWGKILERTADKSRFFLIVAIGGRLTLVFAFFVESFYHLMILMTVLYSFNALYMPLQNAFIQARFKPGNRGRLFGMIASAYTLVILLSNFVCGRLLDIDENWFRYIFAFYGIAGCLGTLPLARIPLLRKKGALPEGRLTLRKMLVEPITRSLRVLRNNRPFAHFELGFFIYGIGFLAMLPQISKYLAGELSWSYSDISMARGVVGQLGLLFLSPLAGRMHDRLHPLQFSALAFLLIALYPAGFLVSSWMSGTMQTISIFMAFVVFGIVMSGLNISWNIGSIHFAGDEDVSMFQGVHLTLVGVRGLIGPFLEYTLSELFNYRMVFIVSSLLMLTAFWLNYRQWRKMKSTMVVRGDGT